jgi:hypothetical protein
MTSAHLHRLLCLLAVGALAVSHARAQTDYRSKATGMLSVGAGFSGGASLALDPPNGVKYKPVFAWRLTADASYPLNPTVGAMLSLGIDSRGNGAHPFNSSNDVSTTRITYFSIYPAFKFSAFTLGVNLGFPLGATVTAPNGVSTDFDEASGGALQTMVEPRLGVVIPVMDETVGWLGITLSGGYTVSDFHEMPSGAEWNDHLVSGHLGVTWQFGIKGTGRR